MDFVLCNTLQIKFFQKMERNLKHIFFITFIYRNITIDMGASKIINYTEEQILVAKYAKALSHPARMAIMQLLLTKQSCICGDIVDELPISQSTVSQHLKELKEAGLVRGQIDGVSICYCINEPEWAKLTELLGHFFEKRHVKTSSCC
ncbi:ArsR/SmtB family transcription factor [Aquirufa beregesia]